MNKIILYINSFISVVLMNMFLIDSVRTSFVKDLMLLFAKITWLIFMALAMLADLVKVIYGIYILYAIYISFRNKKIDIIVMANVVFGILISVIINPILGWQ